STRRHEACPLYGSRVTSHALQEREPGDRILFPATLGGVTDMDTITPRRYDPREFKALTFHDATARFRDGADTPRAYLERCLETIAAREPAVKAFVARNDDAARAAA